MLFCNCCIRYRVDLENRQQINTITGYSRAVRRVSSTHSKKKSKAKAKMGATKKNKPSAVATANANATWEWLDNDDGIWKPYQHVQTQSELFISPTQFRLSNRRLLAC